MYLVLEGISCSLWQGLFVMISRRERQSMLEVLKSYKGPAALTGMGIYLTYGIVLVSMNFVTNVSYVAAFRQLSIPIGAILGMAFLKRAPLFTQDFWCYSYFFGACFGWSAIGGR